MAAKKKAKKRKRSQRKKNKRKKKTPLARFYEKIKKSDDLSPSLVVVEPEGQARMSEVILEFAELLLEQCKDEKSFERRSTSFDFQAHCGCTSFPNDHGKNCWY